MENFDCCKFGIDKIQREKRAADDASALLQEMREVINGLKNKKREFPSGGVVNESAQGEFVASNRRELKKYVIKKEFVKAATKILGFAPVGTPSIFWATSDVEKTLREYGVLEIFCEDVKKEKEWEEPEIDLKINGLTCSNKYRKAHLMIRMQDWAGFHNKLDGFVADWANDEDIKYGLCIYRGRCCGISNMRDENYFLFQIWVRSEERAKQMFDHFRAQIEELMQLKMI